MCGFLAANEPKGQTGRILTLGSPSDQSVQISRHHPTKKSSERSETIARVDSVEFSLDEDAVLISKYPIHAYVLRL